MNSRKNHHELGHFCGGGHGLQWWACFYGHMERASQVDVLVGARDAKILPNSADGLKFSKIQVSFQ